MNHLRSSVSRLVALTALSVVTVACGLGQPGAEAGSTTDGNEIRGGDVDFEHPSVGILRLRTGLGDSLCSATLIAPDVVLTAAHCLETANVVAFYTGIGKAVASTSSDEAIETMTKHEVAGEAKYPRFALDTCPFSVPDVALLKLAAPVADLRPEALGFREPELGEVCTMVGFGLHDEGGKGSTFQERRHATGEMADARATGFGFMDLTGGTETGDSGGPLICAGRIVGVNSCGSRPDWFGRVDAARPWIEALVARWDPEGAAALVAKNR